MRLSFARNTAHGLIIIVLFLGPGNHTCLAGGLNPNKSLNQYVHDVWTADNGLPQNSIEAITQSQDGYLWLGTQEGLCRFDGARFVSFHKGNTEQITNNDVRALLRDRSNNLWIGTFGGGVVRYHDDA